MPHVIDSLRNWLGKPKPYGARHFRKRVGLRDDYRLVAEAILELLDFESVLDVGCANAFLLERFGAAGKEVAGLEQSPAVREVLPPSLRGAVEIGDFAAAPDLWRRPFDLVSCVEVAEHVEPHRSAQLVAVLSGQARRWIYFTAAPPGQSGHGHINCRPHAEWLEWFAELGWGVAPERTAALRRSLAGLERARWLRDNSFILRCERS